MIKVAVIGASGYAGAELLKLALAHPDYDVVAATGDSRAGSPIAELYPNLVALVGDRCFDELDEVDLDQVDLVFTCLPHGASQTLIARLDPVEVVVDLAADFRLSDADLYPAWYGEAHACPERLDQFVYGLAELFRDDLVGAKRIAAAGCYPTAAALALSPLVSKGLVEPANIIIDAASGVSGAGRPPRPTTTFGAVDENFCAYAVLEHRHSPEIEQTLARIAGTEVRIVFTPHLAPMSRGILATCYAQATDGVDEARLVNLFHDTYDAEPFVQFIDSPPATKATTGSNNAIVSVRHDPRTGLVVAMCAIDNLLKGAAGGAIQCANIACGLDEATGLPQAGLYP